MEADSPIPLAREGYSPIMVTLLAGVLLGLGATLSEGAFSTSLGTLAIVAFTGAIFLVNFFRDPARAVPRGTGLVVSPADGRVVAVEPSIEEPRYLHKRAAKVSIFMSPLNVHVNRSPIDGEVVAVHYNPGKYFAAFSEKASLDNEQNAILMRGEGGRQVLFIQIAGFLARRIVCKVRPGDRIERGQRVGMIKLGSRVDVYLPDRVSLRVTRGEVVRAGETVLGVL